MLGLTFTDFTPFKESSVALITYNSLYMTLAATTTTTTSTTYASVLLQIGMRR